jgi:hypothetical protein
MAELTKLHCIHLKTSFSQCTSISFARLIRKIKLISMTGYSIIQIILYIITCILGIAAIIPKLILEDKTKYSDKIILVGFIITLGLSILLELIRNQNDVEEKNEQLKKHKQYIDSLSLILGKSTIALQKSDSTLQSQQSLLNKNDSIINISNRTFFETQQVMLSTTDVLKKQNEQLANFEREKNPLFPMQIEITLRIPFTHESLTNKLPKLLEYKKCFEEGRKCDSSNISVNWVGKKERVYSIRFSKFENLLSDEHFMYRKNIHFRLQKNNPKNYDDIWTSPCLFQGTISENPTRTIISSHMEIDFEHKVVYINFISEGLTLDFPKTYSPIGLSDLTNNYLIVIPGNCSFDIYRIQLLIGKGPIIDLVNIITLSSDIIKINNTCKFYSHKITKNEILMSTKYSNY